MKMLSSIVLGLVVWCALAIASLLILGLLGGISAGAAVAMYVITALLTALVLVASFLRGLLKEPSSLGEQENEKREFLLTMAICIIPSLLWLPLVWIFAAVLLLTLASPVNPRRNSIRATQRR